MSDKLKRLLGNISKDFTILDTKTIRNFFNINKINKQIMEIIFLNSEYANDIIKFFIMEHSEFLIKALYEILNEKVSQYYNLQVDGRHIFVYLFYKKTAFRMNINSSLKKRLKYEICGIDSLLHKLKTYNYAGEEFESYEISNLSLAHFPNGDFNRLLINLILYEYVTMCLNASKYIRLHYAESIYCALFLYASTDKGKTYVDRYTESALHKSILYDMFEYKKYYKPFFVRHTFVLKVFKVSFYLNRKSSIKNISISLNRIMSYFIFNDFTMCISDIVHVPLKNNIDTYVTRKFKFRVMSFIDVFKISCNCPKNVTDYCRSFITLKKIINNN